MILFIIYLYSLVNCVTVFSQVSDKPKMIVDSDITFEESIAGKTFPDEIKADLKIIDVQYYSFDNRLHKGQVIIHKNLANDIKEIFKEIEKSKFPIAKVIPVSKYNWSDSASMLDNNTSAFNYRFIAGTQRLSAHSLGRAIDINPYLNPWVRKTEISPEGAVYNKSNPGTILESSLIVSLFKQRGWEWGGNWKTSKDYQHFEKGFSKN